MSLQATYKIAALEFSRLLLYPLVPLAAVIVIIIGYLNGSGEVETLRGLGQFLSQDMAVLAFGQCWQSTSMICTILAIFLGATSIAYERWGNSLNVLLVKPLYRKNYIMGKFLGLVAFMLVFNAGAILVVGIMIILFIGAPESMAEFTVRAATYTVILTLTCSAIAALNMLIGTVTKSMLVVTSASMIYFFFEWIWFSDKLLGGLSMFTPVNLYGKIINPFVSKSIVLYNTSIPLYQWFNAALPFIALMVVETIVLLLLGMRMFSREDA